ncbi:hypothetical protein JCM9140_3347 [Halalkalibacter wakoensis JCM 9140]|uniref:Cxxc_20_cxxc protein n=1 Tax=Halalkalibacter wakoensis JCM 9140 TaxID=1236970 RepID=W4Q758_9BACI|nr:TIGR04104 family putative zinc finger protein [Halalkalibacter wakoensis]GAE27219.1 hypothetical protein JCM9140_3347 [Halalkalibacter wakoensis JCM 9140]
MVLPICWSCQKPFRWKELLFFIEGRKKCKHCGAKQYSTTHSKWRSGVLVLPIVFIPSLLRLLFDFSFIWQLVLIFGLFIVFFAIAPFYYQFTDKEQPLF